MYLANNFTSSLHIYYLIEHTVYFMPVCYIMESLLLSPQSFFNFSLDYGTISIPFHLTVHHFMLSVVHALNDQLFNLV